MIRIAATGFLRHHNEIRFFVVSTNEKLGGIIAPEEEVVVSGFRRSQKTFVRRPVILVRVIRESIAAVKRIHRQNQVWRRGVTRITRQTIHRSSRNRIRTRWISEVAKVGELEKAFFGHHIGIEGRRSTRGNLILRKVLDSLHRHRVRRGGGLLGGGERHYLVFVSSSGDGEAWADRIVSRIGGRRGIQRLRESEF